MDRCVELTGLSCAAVYALEREPDVALIAHRGFRHPAAPDDFFGHPALLREAAAATAGRIVRLRNCGLDPLRVRSALARGGLALMVLVPVGPPEQPTGMIALGAPRVPVLRFAGPLGHTARVARYSRLLAGMAGLPDARGVLIAHASALHDVGKLALPERLLDKPGPLSAAERTEVQRHAESGYAILSGQGTRFSELAAEIALTHHERWDGSGYPRGLRGQEIPLAGRIAAIADVFDALTSDRPYRPAMGMGAALELMQEGAGSDFDPYLLGLFERAVPRLGNAPEPPAWPAVVAARPAAPVLAPALA